MPQTSMTGIMDGPSIDRTLDKFLSAKVSGLADPLNPGPFPSLGFDGEERGSYFCQITRGDLKVTIWRIINAFGAPETYTVQLYRKHVFNGVQSWGTTASSRMVAESLVQVQGIVHHLLTPGGNDE